MIPISRPMSPPPVILGRNIDSALCFSTTCPSLPRTTDDGFLDTHPLLRVELLERGQGVVRVVVICEGDGDDGVGAPALHHQLLVV